MPPPPNNRRALLLAVVGSTVGTTIEWYDFFLYGAAAALVFPQVFFPEQTEFIGQISAFGTFTVGFLARPLGGVIFGRMGDRSGRKAALVATLLLMGISTLLIGFLPSYRQIGALAPLALVALRFMQGIGVGGEWGGAVLLALESGHRGRRGLLASWPQVGVPIGLLLSTGALYACERALTPEQLIEWGWRLPFFASALLILVGFLIRSFVTESPLFAEVKAHHEVAQTPLREVLRTNWKEIALGAGSRLSENSVFYLFATYLLTYGSNVLDVPRNITLASVNVAAVVACVTIPLYGWLSDVWSRKSLYLTGNVLLIVLALPYYALLDTREPLAIMVATGVMLGIVHAMLYSVQAALIPELFSTRLRYTGASLTYQIAGPFAGGLAPIVATTLSYHFPESYWPIAVYIALLAVISSLCIHFLSETSHKDISG
ncbi:MAG: MHS family MFS transporter [Planctomycetes bacterium]|nr:MHS family MFS transporter [Planctomycetota bacterium]